MSDIDDSRMSELTVTPERLDARIAQERYEELKKKIRYYVIRMSLLVLFCVVIKFYVDYQVASAEHRIMKRQLELHQREVMYNQKIDFIVQMVNLFKEELLNLKYDHIITRPHVIF